MEFKTIGFIGMGLIGGSVARAVKRCEPDTKLFLMSRSIETVRQAYDLGLTESEKNASIEEIAGCDLIILCAPVVKNLEYLSLLAEHVSGETLITDVGSVKGDIHELCIRLDLEEHFIGGHPMAGKEKFGIENSSEEILVGANYVLTPTAKSRESDIGKMKAFVLMLGANPLIIDYHRHDEVAGAISHLPHMISYALADMVREMDTDGLMKAMAAGGFRDMTRVAASSPEMWTAICSSNKKVISSQIDDYIKKLLMIKDYIDRDDSDSLRRLFSLAKAYKDNM